MISDCYETGVKAFDKVFEFLTGDMNWDDHGGKWFRKVSEDCFHVVEIFNWEGTVGEAEAPEETYYVGLTEVDTSLDPKSALECCGFEMNEDGSIGCGGDIYAEAGDEESRLRIICECMSGYGQSAHLEQWNGDSLEELFTSAIEESNLMADDEEAYEERMESPGNRLGSTRREMQRGDFKSAMLRGVARGDQTAKVMSVMHFGRESTEELEDILAPISVK